MPQRLKKLLDLVRACPAYPERTQRELAEAMQYVSGTMPAEPRRPTYPGPIALSSITTNAIRWQWVRRKSASFSPNRPNR